MNNMNRDGRCLILLWLLLSWLLRLIKLSFTIHFFISTVQVLCLLNLLVLILKFLILQHVYLVNYLLLPYMQIPSNRALRIHIFNFPLTFEMHLSFLMAVILDMLISNEEIILSSRYWIRLHSGACWRYVHLLCTRRLCILHLNQVLFYLFLSGLIVALTIFAHVVGVEK